MSLKEKEILTVKIIMSIIIVMFLATGFGKIAYCNTNLEEKIMNYGISLSTDQSVYCPEEPITIKLTIFNRTEENIIFHFKSSQRYDFIIKDEKEKEVWRWSENKMFAMVLGEETLGPNNSEIIYSEKCNKKLIPGYYKVSGVLISTNKEINGSIVIEIR